MNKIIGEGGYREPGRIPVEARKIKDYGYVSSDDEVEMLTEEEERTERERQAAEKLAEEQRDDVEMPAPVDYELPQPESEADRAARLQDIELKVINDPETIPEQKAIDSKTEAEYVKNYLPAKIEKASLESDQKQLTEYFKELSDRMQRLQAVKGGAQEFDFGKFTTVVKNVKEKMADNAVKIQAAEKRIALFEEHLRQAESRDSLVFPGVESAEEQQARVENAEMDALEGRGIFNLETAKQLGLEAEQEPYLKARQKLFVIKSDIKVMQNYLTRLRERNADLKARGIVDVYADKAQEIEAAIKAEMDEKNKEVKELTTQLDAFEDMVRREIHRRETGMPATTNQEAFKDAAKDLAVMTAKAGAYGAGVAATVGALMVKKTGEAGIKGAKKIAAAPGAAVRGAGTAGALGSGFFLGSLVAFGKAIREAFFPNRNK